MREFLLKNNTKVVLDLQNGKIDSIVCGKEKITRGNIPFYSVRLRDRDCSVKVITAFDCKFNGIKDDKAYYTNEFINVTLRVKENGGELLANVSVENKTDKVLEWIEIMPFGVKNKLKDEQDGQGEIVWPYNEGVLITNMAYRESRWFRYCEPEYPSEGAYAIFPNMLCSQFLSYIIGENGLYLGMHDKNRGIKFLSFKYEEDCIKFVMREFCGVNYGENYSMPYDMVITAFNGNYYDSFEIYRNWFDKNIPDGLTKISDTNNLPKWYHESPVIVTYPVRGHYDTDIMNPNKLYPYENCFPILKDIANKTDSKVMTVLMHWEGTAPWAPPYVWPPYGGEEGFIKFVNSAHNNGYYVGLYCSGLGYTIQSNIVKTYNRLKDFESENLKEIMCSNSDGSIKGVICTAQRFGYDVCPACEKSKNIFQNEINKVTSSGVDYVQLLDQNHGGNSYFCYSDKHGHPPVPGDWQVKETQKLLQRIDRNDVLLGCESAASEPMIKELRFSDNRYQINYLCGTPIPLYSYIYHEYVNNFMGNQVNNKISCVKDSLPFRIAYSFTAGDLLTIIINDNGDFVTAWDNGHLSNKEHVLTIIKNLNGWRNNLGKNYLHLGRMVKPLTINCKKISFTLKNTKTKLVENEVLTSAYNYNGKTAQFIVNYNLKAKKITLNEKVNVYYNYNEDKFIEKVDTIVIPPLSAVMITRSISSL